MAVDLTDIGGESCEPVSGLSGTVYYAEQSDFVTINEPKKMCDPVPANVAATYKELSTIETAHTFKTGKCFHKIESVTETGTIKVTPLGEIGRKLYQNELAITVAGSSADLLGFMRWIKNKKLVILFEEFGTGNVRQLGMSRLPALASAEHNIEAAVEGNNSAVITFTDKNFGPAPIYEGAIQLVPEV
ncbi:hypothetical protein [Flavobacterium sp. F52]|uniref:hypothetical protein n=1 Tax=Flavobacterium sp. F52 TaxID=1202532 RepID=UPI000272DFCF|nr:hypothetical protein [Flavobacterium sp. F52]EJG02279.1 hypothetical protein FF52_06350 [Flavobacterium sp. F52]